MNRRQKLVQQQFLNNEKAVVDRLRYIYDQSLFEVNSKIRGLEFQIGDLTEQYDWLDDDDPQKEIMRSRIQSKIYQKQYQEALQGQLDEVLKKMQTKQFLTVSDYLDECYTDGFVGTVFDQHGQGVPLIMPIDQEAMVRAVQLDSKIKEGLYNHLNENVQVLKKNITAQVSRGVATGMSYAQVARQISNKMTGAYKNAGGSMAYAMRIARTEGHRIQCTAAMDAMVAAKDKGADVLKQWDATLDDVTRESHRHVDGEIRELDEEFSNHLQFAGDPAGGAAEVINCRCAVLQRARWALDEDELQTLKDRAAYFGLDKSEEFDDFKKKYLKAVEATEQPESVVDIKLGELETAWAKKHGKAIREHLQKAPEALQRVWNNCADAFRVLDPKYRGKKAYYTAIQDGVLLDIVGTSKGNDYSTPYQTVFHECGHHIDYILNRKHGNQIRLSAFSETYKGGILGVTMKREAEKALDDFAQTLVKHVDVDDLRKRFAKLVNIGFMTEDEVEEAIADELKNAIPSRAMVEAKFCEKIRSELSLMQRSDISDMFEPVMSTGYPFGVGHGTKYWKNRDNGKEAFAEMYSATVNNPESLEQIKRFFPESYKIFEEILEVAK